MGVPAQTQKFRSGSPESVQTAVRKRRKLGVNADKLLGMRVRQRLKEYGVHHREYPGRGSDPKHQAQHRRSGKTQILAHHPNRELEVLPQRFHWIPPPGKDTLETCLMLPVTEDSMTFQACFGIPLADLLCREKPAAAWSLDATMSPSVNGEGMVFQIGHGHALD